jgi:hypothetical protein
MHVDNNFPAPLQVMAFLGSAMVAGVLMLATVYGFLRRKTWVRRTLMILAGGSVVYFGLLVAFSEASKDVTLGRGNEKYFCEIDCHLAYSVTEVKTIGEGPSAEGCSAESRPKRSSSGRYDGPAAFPHVQTR